MSSKRHYLLARIDTDAIVHNCGVIRKLLPENCRMCVAVKCNGYGHGVEVVLGALEKTDVEMVCVATIAEAKEVRELGWQRPILLLGSEFSIYTGDEKGEIGRWLVENDIRVTVTSLEDAESLSEAAEAAGKTAVLHLMFDSGMNRMGLGGEQLLGLISKIRDNEHVRIEGLYTHMATADDADKGFANSQLKCFKEFLGEVKKSGLEIPIIHSANSGAAIDMSESHFDMVRLGISVYGYHSSGEMLNEPDLRPSMKLVSFLTIVKKIAAGSLVGYGCTYKAERDMTIAIVPVGYGDGYDRRLSNIAKMTVAGCAVPVVGRVSMDQTIIDVSGLDVAAGSEVVIIDNDRKAPNSVESLAGLLDTVPNEIVTDLGVRICRVESVIERER